MSKITETVTVQREVKGVILDLIQFARRCGDLTPEQLADNQLMVNKAR